MALTDDQLAWLAEQAGWQKAVLGNDWRRLIGDDEYEYTYAHPSTSCDQLIADHDGWMAEHGITLTLTRWADDNGVWHWSVDMWGVRPAADWECEADTPQAALAEAFYHARGGPK